MTVTEFRSKLLEELNKASYDRFQLRDDGLLLDLGTVRILIAERVYDKFFVPFMEYTSRDEVVYKDIDIDIAINNIRYAAMSEFDKIIFPRKN